MSDEGPVFITFDVSPGAGGPGILLGFTDARRFDRLEPAERRERAPGGFAALFGEEAPAAPSTSPTSVGAQRVFAPGGSTCGGAARVVDAVRPAVANRSACCHWAGTGTADESDRLLDGAVPAGGGAKMRSAALRG